MANDRNFWKGAPSGSLSYLFEEFRIPKTKNGRASLETVNSVCFFLPSRPLSRRSIFVHTLYL